MSTVRAKFRVHNVTPYTNADGTPNGARVALSPVTGGSPENESFFQYTPWGEIVLGTVNNAAADQFKPGTEVYVDFTPVSAEG